MSGLKFKTMGRNQLSWMLSNAHREGRARAFAAMREETYRIKEISVKQAPVDTGELEAAHQVKIHRNHTDKAHYNIVVSGVINGVNVDDYARVIHEGIGWYHLGDKSKIKQGQVAPLRVGEKFLERALADNETNIIRAVHAAMYQGMKRHVG